MVAAAKAAVPTVGDQASALQLGNFAKATAAALAELRAASLKVKNYMYSLCVEKANLEFKTNNMYMYKYMFLSKLFCALHTLYMYMYMHAYTCTCF